MKPMITTIDLATPFLCPRTFKTVVMGLCWSWAVHGQTNVPQSLEQIKTNVENSQLNASQYQDNHEIASQNVVETSAAIKNLQNSRKQLVSGGENVQKNKKLLDDLKKKIQVLSKQEQDRLKVDEGQIAEVKAFLAKLESNKSAREANLAAYAHRLEEIDREKEDWDKQKEQVAELMKEIEAKERQAAQDRDLWIRKRNEYRAEAAKWSKASEVAAQNHTRIKSLGSSGK